MPSIEVRLIFFAILVVAFLLYRTGYFKKRKERLAKEREDAERKQRRREKKERLRKAREAEERQQQKIAKILLHAAPGLHPRTAQAAGIEVYYLEGGAKSDRPSIVLLHGFAGQKEDWAALAANLVQVGWHVIAPDLAGFGQSTKELSLPYDVTSQAKRIRAFYLKLALPRIHLVGCSMGGAIAAACAYGSPEEIASVTLIEPFGVRIPYPSELDELLAQGQNPMVIASPQAYENLRSFLFDDPPALPPALARHFAEQMAQHRPLHLKIWKEIREGDRAFLLDLLLPELKVRTLALLAARSRVLHGATADVIRAMNPNYATAAVIPDCGHFLMVEKPNETAQQLVEFLDLVTRAPQPL